jgi:hypothetical protein
MASTWSDSVIVERSASADSRPGSVSAVTSCPSARRAEATSSHAHAPSQNPATRMIGAEGVGQPYRRAPTRLPARLRLSSLRQQIRQQRGRGSLRECRRGGRCVSGDGGGCAARQRCARRPSAGDLALNRAPSDGERTTASHLASRLDDGTSRGRNRGQRLASVAFVAIGRPGRGRAALGRAVRRAG